VAQQHDDDHADGARGGDCEQAPGKTAGPVLDVADDVGPEKTGEVAERVDRGDAARRRRAREEGGRQGPDQRQRGEHAE